MTRVEEIRNFLQGNHRGCVVGVIPTHSRMGTSKLVPPEQVRASPFATGMSVHNQTREKMDPPLFGLAKSRLEISKHDGQCGFSDAGNAGRAKESKRLAFWARAGAHAKDSCILHLCRCAGALLGEPFALALSRLGRGPKGVMGVMSAALARPGIFWDLWAAFGHVSEKRRPSAEVTLGCDVERGS